MAKITHNDREVNGKYQEIISKLKHQSKRLTAIRKKIIKIISEQEHINVNDIISKLNNENDSVNTMSVYNTIDLLLKEDIIDAKTSINKQVFYELSDDIIHIICNICHKMIDLSKNETTSQPFLKIEQLKSYLENNANFSLSHYNLEIHGKCQDCIKNKN